VTYWGFDVVKVSGLGGTQPATSIAFPRDGSTVSGTTRVTATASSDVGVARLELYIDGTLATSAASPVLTYSWDTSSRADGLHDLFTKVYDADGNIQRSSTVTVTVTAPDARPKATNIRRHVSRSKSG
jgi:hypothetical protein